ncbi:CocE/NonD family hydrolase [Variovorax sp. J22P271]|uniref:CocE/NonD family hydrolase n=1 Tax=Variovorax davisae TaxID=3053515 RepID=UPI00257671CE|nr:CocE/NonD family hydrolase [Variovorax sp. J22P271]MDM0037311.1 CocE/NonD family hydrolase [Variovorax sp. J22P271]
MQRSQVADNMNIDWDVPIETSDGTVLRADVFRPTKEGSYPVLLSYGPYAKGLAFQDGYPSAWNKMVAGHPDVPHGSTNKYQSWEVVDPEKWVREGYVVVRVDSRGCGRSPGYVDHFSPRETQDYYESIEWAAVQPWSTGKVGLNGVSYFGMNQWLVAACKPPHLAAMCVWEGSSDWYRDATHHGGIVSTFWANWYDIQVKSVQNGLGLRGPKSRVTGDLVCGPATMPDAQLQANRSDFGDDILAHPLIDEWHRERTPAWEQIEVPLLSAANWGGQGLHLRGNVEGYLKAGSRQKWLEVHGDEHWTHFYTDYGIALQKQFFGHFLKGEKNGWDERPPVLLQVRGVDGFTQREELQWPIERTVWTKFYLNGQDGSLSTEPPTEDAQITYTPDGDGVTFVSAPLERSTEITGPSACSLKVSSASADADLFLVLRVFTPDFREVTFQGAIDPHTPIGQGWLRASHRKEDPNLSLPWRPHHTHDEKQPMDPGAPVDLRVEILPTSIVVPAGYRIALTVRGRDYEFAKQTGERLGHFKNELRGCGPFLHDDPRDRPPEVFGAPVTLHFKAGQAHVLLPVIS